jgi:DNA-3-methyladenine glycosylase
MHVEAIKPLPQEFYTRKDVVQISRELLGKVLFTSFNNEITAGIIIENEAYGGALDKASHAYNNRRTARTEIMYREGGYAYVYLCYGIHSLFNIVTSVESDPQAVLIRGIRPLLGVDIMAKRAGKNKVPDKNGIGPGNVTKLLGIQVTHSGYILFQKNADVPKIWIQDNELNVPDVEIRTGTRIGVGYAGEDALLPYRFQWIKNE